MTDQSDEFAGATENNMENERVVFAEEVSPQLYLKLIACGPVDLLTLEALEDFLRHQKAMIALHAIKKAREALSPAESRAPGPDHIEASAQAIYRTWAASESISETWDELVRLNHSIVDLARLEARAALISAAPRLLAENVALKAQVELLTRERDAAMEVLLTPAESDSIRLHREKMEWFDRAHEAEADRDRLQVELEAARAALRG